MPQIMVSIIIPVYKTELYLRKCLNSLVKQTFKNFEVILVDDGSPDLSGKICDEYAENDSRFHVIHQQNQGVGKARLTGLKYAKGKYIFWVDSDDYAAPNLLEKVVTIFEKENADMVMFRHKAVYSSYEKDIIPPNAKNKSQWIESSILGKVTTLWSGASKRQAWEGMELPEELAYNGEDGYMMLYAMRHSSKIASCPDYLYFHLIDRSGSIRHSYSSSTYRGSCYLWLYRGSLSKEVSSEMYSYCARRALSNGIKAFCLNLIQPEFGENEQKKLVETIDVLRKVKIIGNFRDKILAWFISHQLYLACKFYAHYKVKKLKLKN